MLDLRRSKLGENHTDTLQSMNNVAVTLYALGKHADALQLHEETLALRETKLPLDHRDTLESMNAVAWILATCPDRKLRNPEKALALAKHVTERAPQKPNFWNTLGAACYRNGDWQGTIRALGRSMELGKGGDASDWFFLAMAHWRLGDKKQARQWYDRAIEWTEKKKPRDEELRRFRAEAAELLEINKN